MIKSVNVCAVGKIQSGISNAGNEWRKQEFVVEWFENPTDTQSQKVVLSVMNDRIEQLNIKYGDKLEVRFDLKYREYNGRYFMDVFAPFDGIVKLGGLGKSNQANVVNEPAPTPQPQVTEPQNQQNQVAGEEKDDDLPF